MGNFRDGLNEIWENKDWDNNSFFEAICELHDKFYEKLKPKNDNLVIELTEFEARKLLNCLIRTNASGED